MQAPPLIDAVLLDSHEEIAVAQDLAVAVRGLRGAGLVADGQLLEDLAACTGRAADEAAECLARALLVDAWLVE